MKRKYKHWKQLNYKTPQSLEELTSLLLENRAFSPVSQLDYGEELLSPLVATLKTAIEHKKRIALYADYDVDGTMSCVSWVWFFKAIGYTNFIYYIPCRFQEGYGVNLQAIKKLIEQDQAEVIITMDTGITANEEASYCRSHGVTFICTDHHKIQPDKVPDGLILNPKLHHDLRYQELCGCGITFVLLRQLGRYFQIPNELWVDLLALAALATICDVVPLTSVNHRLVRMGMNALAKSQRPVLKKLKQACTSKDEMNEQDVGFRLGPRINAVGRLEHGRLVVEAFAEENPEPLIEFMEECNQKRKTIQNQVVQEAHLKLLHISDDDDIIFLGGDWHPGVVGIAAARLAEVFWRPTWLFQIKDGVCKGSARSIPGFDVTETMKAGASYFSKFGGHRAAGGFTFKEAHMEKIGECLRQAAGQVRQDQPHLWESHSNFDCILPDSLLNLDLASHLSNLRPFGSQFEEPKFMISGFFNNVRHLCDKVSGEQKHTQLTLTTNGNRHHKVMFFNSVIPQISADTYGDVLVTVSKNHFRGNTTLQLLGVDFRTYQEGQKTN